MYVTKFILKCCNKMKKPALAGFVVVINTRLR